MNVFKNINFGINFSHNLEIIVATDALEYGMKTVILPKLNHTSQKKELDMCYGMVTSFKERHFVIHGTDVAKTKNQKKDRGWMLTNSSVYTRDV